MIARSVFSIFCMVFLLVFPGSVTATVYEVGPDHPFLNIGDVPWENLSAGDEVRIHWRREAYNEKWVISVTGTEKQPFIVRGVPNGQGELPVVDGRDAITRSELNFWNEDRGIIKIGGSNNPPDNTPTWIVIESLDIRSGRPPHRFSGRYGQTDYLRNCAAIFIEKGEHIIIRNCILRDSGNGLFSAHASKDILVEGCWIYDNGVEGSIYEHNNYTEAMGIVFQYNQFGPLRENCSGNNLKDRSSGTVIRYNWIEGGNRQLDLVDAGDEGLFNSPLYRQTFVYGNILIEPDGAGNSQIIHYGGDSGNTERYRKGTLYFYNNTVISTRSGNTTLLRLSTNDEACDSLNNIVYTTASGGHLALLNQAGVLNMRNNWLKSNWQDSHSGLTGEIYDNGSMLTGDEPGFADANAQDYRLAAGSVCIDAGTTLDLQIRAEHILTRQYEAHRATEPRPSDGKLDIGAFEFMEPNESAPKPPTNLRVIRP